MVQYKSKTQSTQKKRIMDNKTRQYNEALAAYGLTLDEFIKIRRSTEFTQLDEQMKAVAPRYLDITPTIREVALVAVLAGKQSNLKNIFDKYYTRPIVSFSEFMDDYLPETTKSLFPVWRKNLTEFFDPNKAYFEQVYGGSIGTGKSTAGMIAQLYNLSRITSLAKPQQAMGVANTTQLTLLLMSLLKGKAGQVLLGPLVTLLNECPMFEKVDKPKHLQELYNDTKGVITPFYEGGDHLQLCNNIFVQVGSQMQHAIGAGLFGAVLDEASFRRGATAESTYALYYQIKERVRSRFIGLRYICLSLISSVTSDTDMITQYIKTLPENSPHTKVYDYPIWEVRFPNAIREDGYFYVMRGNRAHPSRVLTEIEAESMDQGAFVVPSGCKVIKVPRRYEQEFNTNVSIALMNLAGMASAGDEKPFSDTSTMEDPKLAPELELEINLEQPGDPIYDIGQVLLDAGVFIGDGEGGYRSARNPYGYTYIHCDLAQSGVAGISMFHKELSNDNKVYYVADFLFRIVTKTSISFESIKRLLYQLKYKFNVKIHTLTFDQYQSTMMLQFCKSNKLAENVHLLSVDRTAEAYYQMSTAVSASQVKVGTAPTLRKELDIIRISNNKPYAEGGVRKDLSDSCTGSVFNALSNGSDIPTHLYDEITKEYVYDTIKEELMSVHGFKKKALI